MENTTFTEKVKRSFHYLESEFAFKIAFSRNSEIRPQTDGIVKYESDTILVLIDSETGYATVRIARAVDGEKYYLTPVDIHEYLNTSNKEKEILRSTNPDDQSAASALFNEKSLLNQPNWKGSRGTEKDVEKELRNFSNWLRVHADLCLSGDFSKWPQLFEHKIQRARADYLRRGKDELGYARVKDTEGNWKLVKQSIFKDDLDYIERLKKEISR